MATSAFEDAREDVARFVGGRPGDTVVFVRNTTEAINVLAAGLPAGAQVLTTPVEHHSNMLPWRRHGLRTLPFTRSAGEFLEACDDELRAARPRVDVLALTGASNVTGEIPPLAEVAEIAHRHGARLFVDAAQLAPHRPIDMAGAGIDFLALSGHKLYAPFGAGALVARAGLLAERPLLEGGGAIKWVTLDDVVWADAPERHEAGSPNVVGVIALAAACRRLSELGMERIAEAERSLFARLLQGLESIPGLETLSLWPAGTVDRVGVVAFNLADYRHSLLATVLSAEHAIGVRNGCFCAQPLVMRLLGVSERRGRAPPLRAARRRAATAAGSRAGEPRHRQHSGGRRPADRRPDRDRRVRPAGALRARAGARRVPGAGGERRRRSLTLGRFPGRS